MEAVLRFIDNIKKSCLHVYTSIRNDNNADRKRAALYVVMLVVAAILTCLATTILNSSRGVGPRPLLWYRPLFIRTIEFLGVSCLLRRYWQTYVVLTGYYMIITLRILMSLNGHYPDGFNAVQLFWVWSSQNLIATTVPILTLYALCCLARLPCPQSKGWGLLTLRKKTT